jgi:hypothetical protein
MVPLVEFAKPFGEVPAEARADLLIRLREIMDTVDSVPRTSAIWESIEVSTLVLDVHEWRFEYRVERGGKRIVVESALFLGE